MVFRFSSTLPSLLRRIPNYKEGLPFTHSGSTDIQSQHQLFIKRTMHSLTSDFLGSMDGTATATALKKREFRKRRKIAHLPHDRSMPGYIRPSLNITSVNAFSQSVAPEQFQSRYSDKTLFEIGGYSESLEHLSEIVQYLQNPKEYTDKGKPPLKGIVLYGPPGVGKTMIAESIAGHAGARMLFISAAELQSSLVGDTEAKLRILFRKAKNIADKEGACVIVIDEFESIAVKRITQPERNAVNAHYINLAVNQLLTLLSEVNKGVVVIATTNNIDMLDPAVTRPGRFDKLIYLSLPNQEDRKQILAIHTKSKTIHSDVSLDDLAFISEGFSGAKIAGWVNEALLCASKENETTLTMKHFDRALTLITHGIPRKYTSDPDRKRYTALHESGHALVGHILKRRIHKISIIPHNESIGHTQFYSAGSTKSPLSKEELLDEICIALAGRASELVDGIALAGCKRDVEEAKKIASYMVESEAMGSTLIGSTIDVECILQKQLKRAQTIIKENQIILKRLIDALVQHHELLREEILAVIEGKELPEKDKDRLSLLTLYGESEALPGFSLPPKMTRRVIETETTDSIVKIEEINIPFTIDQIAKALELDASKIRSIEITYNGGIDITFKPSFKDRSALENLSKILEENDIENFTHAFLKYCVLEIQKGGIQDFYKYIENKLSGS